MEIQKITVTKLLAYKNGKRCDLIHKESLEDELGNRVSDELVVHLEGIITENQAFEMSNASGQQYFVYESEEVEIEIKVPPQTTFKTEGLYTIGDLMALLSQFDPKTQIGIEGDGWEPIRAYHVGFANDVNFWVEHIEELEDHRNDQSDKEWKEHLDSYKPLLILSNYRY